MRNDPRLQGNALSEVGDFIVSMVQAFLRTGYYLPEHPQSKKALEGLYERFSELVEKGGEIHFFIREEGGGEAIFIEGPLDSASRLRDIMPLGMADTYNPRFINFLKRKGLVSLTLSSRMRRAEFTNFINLMSEPAFVDMKEAKTKEKFLHSLRRLEIRNVSWIFNEDLISVRRDIPWRVGLALSRLRKDLRLLPVYADAKKEDLVGIKRQILSDVIRPIVGEEQPYVFLMNLDLTYSELLPENDAEDEFFRIIDEGILMDLAGVLIQDASGKKRRYHGILPSEKFQRVLEKVTAKLVRMETQSAGEHLWELFELKLLPEKSLTPEVRERIMLFRLIRSFVNYSDTYLDRLETRDSPQDFSGIAVPLARIVPYLLESGHYGETVALAEALVRKVFQGGEKSLLARKILDEIGTGQAMERAKGAFLTASKEGRIRIGRFFEIMGSRSAEPLVCIVKEGGDIWRRKQAVEILMRMGKEYSAFLADLIRFEKLDGEVAATVIKVLSGVQDDDLKALVADASEKRVEDSHPAVRREALHALIVLEPGGRKNIYEQALSNTDARTREEGIRGLGFSGEPEAFGPLRDLIETARQKGAIPYWENASWAVVALGHLRDCCEPVREEVDEYILSVAQEGIRKRGLSRLMASKRRYPPEFLKSLTYTLGRLCSPQAEKFLAILSMERDESLARRARTELEKINGPDF